MSEATRKMWALRYQALLAEGRHKKEAMFLVQKEIAEAVAKRTAELIAEGVPARKAREMAHQPSSRRQIYAWCEKFKIDIR